MVTIPYKKYYPESDIILINGQEWTFRLNSSKCEKYSELAIREYSKEPVYAEWRKPSVGRYFESNSAACWVEVEVFGIDTFYFIFKIDQNGQVIDKKMFSERAPHIQDYPLRPFE